MHKQTNKVNVVTRNDRRMGPSGLNRHGGLLDRRGSGGHLRSHYRVDNSNTNPLHLNAHSFGHNCNQYIYIYAQCVVLIAVEKFVYFVELSVSLSLCRGYSG